MNRFERFYRFLANMGLVLRDDPPKVIELAGREWGAAVEGVALSIRELPRDDSNHATGISVVLRNSGSEPCKLTARVHAFFYDVEGLTLSAYGQKLLTSGRNSEPADVTLKPGDAIETDLPLARIYDMRAQGGHRIRVSCRLPNSTTLQSNEITVTV